MSQEFAYEQFSQLPTAMRRGILQRAVESRGEQATTLLMVTTEKDPDAELRDFAARSLSSMGFTIEKRSDGQITFSKPTQSGETLQLNGGDGFARTRGELARLPNLFLIRQRNMRYLEDQTNMIAGDRFPLLGVLLVFVPATIAAAVAKAPIIFVGIFALLCVALFFGVISTFRRLMRLEREGTLLQGQLTSMRGYWRASSTTNSRGNNRRTRTWTVEIGYVFRTSDGNKLTGFATQSRPDLKDAPPLPAGTPVAVLYVDEKTYQLL